MVGPFRARLFPMTAESFDHIWDRIKAHAGEPFHQVKGSEFRYAIVSGAVVPDRTNRNLPRRHFERAWERRPLTGPGQLQDLQGPSYLFAILSDSRIRGDHGAD
jgi:hypothetical protein